MADQTAALSSKEPRVVAIVFNGAKWKVLATREGLKSCLEKHQRDPSRHCQMPNLQEFVWFIKALEILLPEDPNVDHPELTRRVNFDDFEESGENYRDTGSSLVDHQRAGLARSVAVT